MTVKEKTAAILEQNRGKYISGADIASELGVSRNAVWKAIKSLTAEGFQIDAVTNKGYCLAEGSDVLSEQSVKKYLPEELWEHLIVRHTVTSTNTLLKEMAAKGAPEGTIMIAAEQTAGKGRFDRKFVSEVCGVYFSIVLRPSIPASEALMITTAAAAATAEAVEAVSGRKTGIKWVNDVFIDGKKICGILTEAAFGMEGGGLDYAVLGIGINVKAPEGGFKGELANIADGVFGEDEDVDRVIGESDLLSAKKVIYAANMDEEGFTGNDTENERLKAVQAIADAEGAMVLPICAKLEEDIAGMDADEKEMFLSELGLHESGLDRLIKVCYDLLGLMSYLTAGEQEVRAWTIEKGTKAPQAAGKIHSDFERGFIRAEVINYKDLIELGSLAAAREKGLVRSEGKEYVMQDGDVVLFRFNV